tara:strand:- start:2054 stop:2494 length:441 start_codon:yes stop_codon:yes gene_type:complete
MILQDQVKFFSYLGLLPFILVPVVAWISPETAYNNKLIEFFYSWSVLMFAFMTGTFWILALKNNQNISMVVGLFALLFVVMASFYSFEIINPILFLLSLLILYELGYLFEKKLIKDMEWYKNLRFHLTFSIRICHLLMIAFIFTNQ